MGGGAVPLGGATNFEVTDTCMPYPHFTPLFLGSVSEKLIAAWSKGGRGLARPPPKKFRLGGVLWPISTSSLGMTMGSPST